MLWTAVAVAGMACLVAAALIALGTPAALAVAGTFLLLAGIDGRR